MTKGELQSKINKCNSKSKSMNGTNKCNITPIVRNLGAAWNTSNGQAIVYDLNKAVNDLEKELDNIEKIINNVKSSKISASYSEEISYER